MTVSNVLLLQCERGQYDSQQCVVVAVLERPV